MMKITKNCNFKCSRKSKNTNKDNNSKINEIIELENIKSQSRQNLTDNKIKKLFNKVKIVNHLVNDKNINKTKNIKNIFDLDYIDLEKEKYLNAFSEINKDDEFNKLRKEKEEQIIKKEKEEKIKKEKNLFLQRRLKILELNKNRKLPFINGKELTFDSNGNILSKNLFSISKLQKEFIPIKYKLSEKSIQNLIKEEKLFKNENISELLTNKKVNPKKEEPIKNNILNSDKANNDKIKKEEIKYQKININQLKINKNKISNITKRDKNYKVEYNPKDKVVPNSFEIEYKKRIYNKVIVPSGSNLEEIIPSTGVVVKFNHYKRDGGFDYFKKYNKPSFNDFNKLALSYSQGEIKEKLLLTNDYNFSSNDKNNIDIKNENNKILYNGYKENFDESNNPLISNAHKLSHRNNSISNYSIKILKKAILVKNNEKILLSNDLRNKTKFRCK